jgi:CelD/BcsL family acetyltransferase involved in cellulose biosynthesis
MSLPAAMALGPTVWDSVGATSPFMSWAWHRAWLDSAPAAEADASAVVVQRGTDGSICALVPLRLGRVRFRRVSVRALTWAIGDIGCPDELDVAAAPATNWPAVAATLEALPWQVIILSNLAPPPDAPNTTCLLEALANRGHAVRSAPLWSCPALALPPSWPAYLATLSANRRQVLRRKERALARDRAARLVDYDADRLDEGWNHLLRLHAQRWDGAGGGAFSNPRAARLQRAFAGEMAQRRRLWLTTLDLDGRPAAAWYGFTSHDTVYFYQGGRDPRRERESVGLVLMGMMIRRAIERGYRTFHFLRGDDPYKRHWTTARRTTREAVVFRAGWRGLWVRALDAAAGLRAGVRSDA